MELSRATLEGWLAWRGREAVDAAGEPLGTIIDIYLDQRLEQPTWALVDLGTRIAFAPLRGAAAAGATLRLAVGAATIRRAPTAPSGEELSEPIEAMLRRHYEEPGSGYAWEAPRTPARPPVPRAAPWEPAPPRDATLPAADPAAAGPARPGRPPAGTVPTVAIGIAALLALSLGALLTEARQPAPPSTRPAGTVAPKPARPPGTTGHAVRGGTFESGFDGWAALPGDLLERTTAGQDGWGLIARDGAGARGTAGSVAMIRPEVLRGAARGTRIRASAWVRVTRPGAAVDLRLVESRHGRPVAVDARVVTVTDREWRRLTVSGALDAAASDLDLQVSARGMDGGALLMDGVLLEVTPPGAPS